MLKKKLSLPTGFIGIMKGDKSELEFLSIGDYGKQKNIKADFLGFKDEINGVPNGTIQSLSEKWVMTFSTQYGCSCNCTFCDVPNIDFKGNATFDDLMNQLEHARNMFPDVKYTDRLNIHFARMGEPAFNFSNIWHFSAKIQAQKDKLQKKLDLRIETIHPVFTTMMPKAAKNLEVDIRAWCTQIKNDLYSGQAGLQLSINSTCEEQRKEMFKGNSLTLKEISEICKTLPEPLSRKYTLNFALADGYEADGEKLKELFDPEKFMVKITPIHNNNACKENNINTSEGYHSFTSYKKAEQSFKNAGFDVLIFIPSIDEEDGCVTCGNAILGGSKIKI